MSPRHSDLLSGSIPRHLLRLFLPQLVGFFTITAYNFADSWFVSRLDDAVAATGESLYLSSFSMTFPVVFAVGSIAIGFGIAITTLVARAVGAGDMDQARRLSRDSLLLTILFTLMITVAGLATIRPLFTLMGARPEQLPLIRSYMTIWYSGAVFMLIPMAGNHVLRGAGNTFWPGVVMTCGALLNIVLDPILIYGAGPVPAMGIAGSAWATVIARSCTAFICLGVLIRWQLISFARPALSHLITAWRELLHYGLPGIIGKMMLPLLLFAYNRMGAMVGKNAVAALNAGLRIEQLVMMVVMALAIVVMIFNGQNLAGGAVCRSRRAMNLAYGAVAVFILASCTVLWLQAPHIAAWFNPIPEVQRLTTVFFRIISFSYIALALGLICQQSLFALRRPRISAALEVTRILLLCIPAGLLGLHVAGFSGMITGLALANIAGCLLVVSVFEILFRRRVQAASAPPAVATAD